MSNTKRVLSVGIATLDIVNTVAAYPREDDDVRAISQQVRRGGNAANTADVLSQLGCSTRWLGVLGDDPASQRVTEALDRAGIDYSDAPVVRGGKVPTSCITLSRASGSRTIVHYRDLRELRSDDFTGVRLDNLDWLHFEGRNVDVTPAMIGDARERAPNLPISVEVEKPREGIETMAGQADVVFYGKTYARSRGFADGYSFLAEGAAGRGLGGSARLPGGGIHAPVYFCAWGERGAWVETGDGTVYHEAAHELPSVVDTTGAGDVFNAAAIHALLGAGDVRYALGRANRLAAAKCAQDGLANLAEAL